jgi:hypothetical protein
MIKKEQILKVLKKYGYYSLNRAPYLYQNEESSGLYFIWPTKNYGNLERVLFFDSEDSLEEEVYKYWWFMNNKNKVNIDVVFDDYQVLSPKVTYVYNNTILDVNKMKTFSIDNQIVDDKENLKIRQLQRTANILILILKEKIKLQNSTYYKVLELKDKLQNLNNEYNKKLMEYNKTKTNYVDTYELLEDENDESEKITNILFEKLANLKNIEELRSFIKNIVEYLASIDSSTVHIQNVYLLNRYPFEINDMEKKISILDKYLKHSKLLFKSHQKIEDQLNKIDENSECKKLININVYVDKEKKSILEKYKDYLNVDDVVLGDYIIEIEKLDINIPKILEAKQSKTLSFAEALDILKNNYEKLNKREKSACHIASSFLINCLNYLSSIPDLLFLSTNDVINNLVSNNNLEIFNESYKALDDYLNTNIRVKYFSLLKLDSLETFISSLIDALHILNKLNIKLEDNFFGYYTSKDTEIIPIYSKNIFHFNNQNSYMASILASTPLYYSPVYITKPLDIIENNNLEIKNSDSLFLLNSKISIKTDTNPVIVTQYERDKVSKKKDYIIINNMKENNKHYYYNDSITCKEDNV